MDTPIFVNQKKIRFIRLVETEDIDNRTYQEWLPIGMDSKREPEEFVLSVHLEDGYSVI